MKALGAFVGVTMSATHATFLVGRDGRISKMWPGANGVGHTEEALAAACAR